MPILRDLVTRITFRTDTTQLRTLDRTLVGVKRTIAGIAATALGGWAVASGQSLLMLEEQLKELEGGAISPLFSAIEKLREAGKLTPEGAGLFREKDLQAAGVSLRRTGATSQEAAKLLELASLVVVRAGGNIRTTASELGRAIQEGGISEYLRGLGLISRETEFSLKLIESKIAAGSGEVAELATRAYRRKILEGMDEILPQLEKSFEKFTGSEAAKAMRVAAAAGTMWDTLAKKITASLGPALDSISKLFKWVEDTTKEFGGLEKIVGKVATAIENVFKSEIAQDLGKSVKSAIKEFLEILNEPLSAKMLGGLTVGGLMMAYWTRNPVWLMISGLAGFAAYKKIEKDFEEGTAEREDFLKRRRFIDPNTGKQLRYIDPLGMQFERAKEIAERREEPFEHVKAKVDRNTSDRIIDFFEGMIKRAPGFIPKGALEPSPASPKPGALGVPNAPAATKEPFPTTGAIYNFELNMTIPEGTPQEQLVSMMREGFERMLDQKIRQATADGLVG